MTRQSGWNSEVSHVNSQVSSLSRLAELNLNDNQLIALPPSIGDLSALVALQLKYNGIRSLPMRLGHLPALRTLELEGNPLPPKLLQLAARSLSSSSGIDLLSLRKLLEAQGEGDRQRERAASGLGGQQSEDNPLNSRNERGRTSKEQLRQVSGSGRSESAADILILDDGGTGAIGRVEPPCYHDDDMDKDEWRRVGAVAAVGSAGIEDEAALSAADAGALEEVMSMPPAAAAVLYRTWDTTKTGVMEVQQGRPLTRGGTAAGVSSGGGAATAAASRILVSSGRPPTSTRAGLASSSASRPSSAIVGSRPTTASSGPSSASSQSVVSLLGQSERAPPRWLSGASGIKDDEAAAAFDGLPPITFPLTSGVRSMLRQMSGGAGKHLPDTGGGGQAREHEEGPDLDLVRSLLGARRPELLSSLAEALGEE